MNIPVNLGERSYEVVVEAGAGVPAAEPEAASGWLTPAGAMTTACDGFKRS